MCSFYSYYGGVISTSLESAVLETLDPEEAAEVINEPEVVEPTALAVSTQTKTSKKIAGAFAGIASAASAMFGS